jgi:hypothetical protein
MYSISSYVFGNISLVNFKWMAINCPLQLPWILWSSLFQGFSLENSDRPIFLLQRTSARVTSAILFTLLGLYMMTKTPLLLFNTLKTLTLLSFLSQLKSPMRFLHALLATLLQILLSI